MMILSRLVSCSSLYCSPKERQKLPCCRIKPLSTLSTFRRATRLPSYMLQPMTQTMARMVCLTASSMAASSSNQMTAIWPTTSSTVQSGMSAMTTASRILQHRAALMLLSLHSYLLTSRTTLTRIKQPQLPLVLSSLAVSLAMYGGVLLNRSLYVHIRSELRGI